jgi:hypothetical protein
MMTRLEILRLIFDCYGALSLVAFFGFFAYFSYGTYRYWQECKKFGGDR